MKSKVVLEEAQGSSPVSLLFAAALTLIFLSALMSSADNSSLSKDSVYLHSEWSPED